MQSQLIRSTYSFPLLKTAEIVFCLNELGLGVTEEILLHPDKFKDQYWGIFSHLVEVCTGVSAEELNQPAFSGLGVLIYPELHEESIPQLHTFRACQKMMDACGVTDFSIKDFIAPNAKRLRRHLSAIVNFAKFREERNAIMKDLTTQRDTLMDQLSNSRHKNEELAAKLDSLKLIVEEESATVNIVEIECKEVEANIGKVNNKQAEIRERSSELKAISNQLKDEISAASLRLEEKEAERRKIQGQIVNSPEKFRKQISDVAQSLLAEQTDCKSFEKKSRELSSWQTAAEDALASINVSIVLF